MKYKFSEKSLGFLQTCHPDLQKLFEEVIKSRDCTITEGYRSDEKQEELFKAGKSKVKAGVSKHNKNPSLAIDVYPYPVSIVMLDSFDTKEWDKFYHFVGYVKGVADTLYNQKKMQHKIRCGADWDGDNCFKDQTFNDLPHFELLEETKQDLTVKNDKLVDLIVKILTTLFFNIKKK